MNPRLLLPLWLLALQTGCLCANQFRVSQPLKRDPGSFSAVTVAPFQLSGLSELPDDAREVAKRLTEYVSEKADARPARSVQGGRVLRVEGRFTDYQKQFLFRPGSVAIEVTFRDETGALLARGVVTAGNPGLGRGSYASCTTVEELGGGVFEFMEDHFKFPH